MNERNVINGTLASYLAWAADFVSPIRWFLLAALALVLADLKFGIDAARYRGEVRPSRDPAFKEFESLAWGYRAIFVLLDTYRIRYGLDTLRGMISRWAPPSENHTDAYIRAVAADTGLDSDERLDTHDARTMIPVAAAISRVENGTPADMRQVAEGWRLFRGDS